MGHQGNERHARPSFSHALFAMAVCFLLAASQGLAAQAPQGSATITVSAADSIGSAGPVAFGVFDANGNEVARGDADAEGAQVPSGSYLVIPYVNSEASEIVRVSAGEQKRVELPIEDSVWMTLRFYPSGPGERVLVPLHPRTELGARVTSLRFPNGAGVGVPRPGATPEEAEAALVLARRYVDEQEAAIRKAVPDDAPARVWNDLYGARLDAERILVLYGDASDVARLVPLGKPGAHWSMRSARLAAQLEARLGRLDDGELARAARGKDRSAATAAAVALHEEGIRAHDRVLVRALTDPAPGDFAEWYSDRVARALRDAPPERALPAYHAVLKRYWERVAELEREKPEYADNAYDRAARVAAAYLLAHGGGQEWQQAARVPLDVQAAGHFMSLSRDPRGLIRAVESYDVMRLADFCGALPDPQHLAYARERFIRETDEIYTENRIPMDPFFASPFDMATVHCRPSHWAAGWYYRGLVREVPGLKLAWPETRLNVDEKVLFNPHAMFWSAWTVFQKLDHVPEPGYLGAYVEGLGKGDTSYAVQLDYVESARLEQALAPLRGRDAAGDRRIDLALAAHRIATRGHTVHRTIVDDGVDRRVYFFRRPESNIAFGGGLAGVVDVDARRIEGSRIEVGVRLRQEGHYFNQAAGLANMISKPDGAASFEHHPYVADGGTSLVSAVRFRRGFEAVALERKGVDAQGIQLYEVDLGEAGLAGGYLEVELGFFDQKTQLVYELSGSRLAREERIGRTEPAAGPALAASGRAVEAR